MRYCFRSSVSGALPVISRGLGGPRSSLALKEAKVPVELHVYAQGGHGYGLRRTEQPVTTWPDRLTDWMRSRGLLKLN
ncbi:MAG TPA: hypothetical protein VFZ59_26075 [Verrucomicrobiae bacterium]|nr:hypothetical protein [Verrucomicrobiae bacterium]